MKLKTFKPVTPSVRNLIRLNKTNLTKTPLLKSKICKIKQSYGKNNEGKITSYCIGGGHKKKYRNIDFNYNKNEIGIVVSIEHDPFRSSNIASIYNFINKKFSYKLASKDLTIGDIVKSGLNADIKNGHSLPISKVPVGCLMYNVSVKKNFKAQISRSAGTYSQLIEKTPLFSKIKLSSGKQIIVSTSCTVTIGRVSNELSLLTTLGKAGRSRWLNRRPNVRGVAMNPIDHPHGGGEGKTSGGRSSVTAWGKPTKGGKTSRSKKIKYE